MARMIWIRLWMILFGIKTCLISAQDYVYEGCFYDIYNNRNLKDLVDCSDRPSCHCSVEFPYCQDSQSMTVQMCETICRAKNYRYFGLEAGDQCFCGGHFSRPAEGWLMVESSADIARCQQPCAGNTDQECGADFLIRIYRFTDPLEDSICFHPGIIQQHVFLTPINQPTLQDFIFEAGETIDYTCEQRGHYVVSTMGTRSPQISCLDVAGGIWDPIPPAGCDCCLEECPPPVIPDDALISSGSTSPDGAYFDGDSVSFVCLTNFSLFAIRCSGTMWTDPGNPCGPTTTTEKVTTIPTTTRSPCPNVNCNIQCPYGYLTYYDDLGCIVCQCRPPPTTAPTTTTQRVPMVTHPPPPVCPPLNCGLQCLYGLQQDNNGCFLCQCVCPTINCALLNCLYGHSLQTDHTGCLICVCNPPPIQPTVAKSTAKAATTPQPHVCPPNNCNTDLGCTNGIGSHHDVNDCITCYCVSGPEPTTEITTETKATATVQSTKHQPTHKAKTTVAVVEGSGVFLLDYMPFIVGGVALMGMILLIVLALNCRQSKKHKGPAPPPPDYPTIERNHLHQYNKESAYDTTITNTNKRKHKKEKKKKRKNSNVQNDIPEAPPPPGPPPTISKNAANQSFSNIHSLDRSMKGAFHSPQSQSLHKFPAGISGKRPRTRPVSDSPNSLSLGRSAAGGRLTPNSLLMGQSVSSATSRRFVPIDQMYANTLNRSVASDPNAFGTMRSASSTPQQHRATMSYQNTPTSQHKVIRPQPSRQYSHQSHHGSTLSMATHSSEKIPLKSADHTSSSYQNTPMSQHKVIRPQPSRQSSHQSHHGSMVSMATHSSEGRSADLPNSTGSEPQYQNTLEKKGHGQNPMYVNLPAHGTLDRVNVDLFASDAIRDDHTYMDPTVYNSAERSRSSYRGSPHVTSTPRSRSHDRKHKSGVKRGPRFNRKMSSSISSLNSHFGDDKFEATTPL